MELWVWEPLFIWRCVDLQVYLSSLQGRRVFEVSGEKAATFVDLTIMAGMPTSEAKSVLLRTAEGIMRADASKLVIGKEGMICQQPHQTWEPLESVKDEVRLIDDVMDKQVIDIENRKVIRVNDIEMDYSPGHVVIKAVCVGASSFMRRLGGNTLLSLTKAMLKDIDNKIDWDLVQPLGSTESAIKLTVPWDKAAKLHPADLADLMEDLDAHEQLAILNTLDVEKAADTLASIEEEDVRRSIMSRMDVDKVSDIMEEMDPDDAADILADLPEGSADAILSEMEKPNSQSLRRLMTYGEHTAGGIMTTEYVALPDKLTADEAVQRLRVMAEDVETIYYAYVVDSDNHLAGVFSLKDLILSKPGDPLAKIVASPVIHAYLDESDDEVVDIMAKYDLLALPVTDRDEHIVGIITIDDVMDVVIERGGWRRQIKARRR
jgi:magnesium transporter